MGLDQYVFIRNPNLTYLEYSAPDLPEDQWDKELFYWRKHADLQGWMERLYRSKGGTVPMFNCENLDLTLADIEQLSDDHETLPTTTGFFFGRSHPEHIEKTQQFISLATDLLRQGHQLYYTSWW